MCLTRSIPWTKPPSTASHSSLPAGGSPRRARTLRQPCCCASYTVVLCCRDGMNELRNTTYCEGDVDLFSGHVGACQVHASLDAEEALTCLYHLRCEIRGATASIPTSGLAASARRIGEGTRQVISINSGPKARMRSIRSRRFWRP